MHDQGGLLASDARSSGRSPTASVSHGGSTRFAVSSSVFVLSSCTVVELLRSEGLHIEDLVAHAGTTLITVPTAQAPRAERALRERALTCEMEPPREEYQVR